jgi:hypothetical protein
VIGHFTLSRKRKDMIGAFKEEGPSP